MLISDGQEGAPFKLSGPRQPFDVQTVSTFNMHVADHIHTCNSRYM